MRRAVAGLASALRLQACESGVGSGVLPAAGGTRCSLAPLHKQRWVECTITTGLWGLQPQAAPTAVRRTAAVEAAAPLWCQQAAAGRPRGFADEATATSDANLAPCERRWAVEQQANQLDSQLAAAAGSGAGAVLALVEAHAEQFTEMNVVSALRAVAAAAGASSSTAGSGSSGMEFGSPEEVVRADAFQALVDMTLAGMQRFPPALLAEAVHACGMLGASEEMLLDEIGRHIMGHISQLGPADIVHLAAGYAALDHAPSLVLFEALAGRAAGIEGKFSPEQRRALAAAYEALGYGSKAPFKA